MSISATSPECGISQNRSKVKGRDGDDLYRRILAAVAEEEKPFHTDLTD